MTEREPADWPPVYDPGYRPDRDDPYWFRDLECEPVAQRNARILRKLQAQVAWAYARSDFYRRMWDAAGVGPHTLRSLDDLNEFPVVTKAELRATLGVRAVLRLEAPGALPRTEFKARRVIDNRDLYEQATGPG